MKLGEIIVHMDNYNFTKFHQNQVEKQKGFINTSNFFTSEFQSVSRIVKIVYSASDGVGVGLQSRNTPSAQSSVSNDLSYSSYITSFIRLISRGFHLMIKFASLDLAVGHTATRNFS